MGWWKASPPPEDTTSSSQPLSSTPTPAYPAAHPTIPTSTAPSSSDACPVDPKTREIWLSQARAQTEAKNRLAQSQQQTTPTPTSSPSQPTPPSQTPLQPLLPPSTSTAATKASRECSSATLSSPSIKSHVRPPRPLSQDREISSIPRANPLPTDSSTPTLPANNETETGTHASGNWIYPSESQFFHAVMSKSSTTTSAHDLASSVSSIIPIHNAVNERAWSQIKRWELDSSAACGGPKLLSFKGLGAGALSPRAKWKSWVLGYQEPFDRHDWVVERCGGERVEYVIDFYQGESGGRQLGFYLDVRPKLNSWEGLAMRVQRFWGWR